MGYLLQNGGLGMAGDWIITGGRPLQGRVEVPAAKNSALPLLAAALLCSGPVRLQNVPRLTDVEDCLALLRGVGCTAGYAELDRLLAGLGAQIWQEIPARRGLAKKTPMKKQFCLAIGAKK